MFFSTRLLRSDLFELPVHRGPAVDGDMISLQPSKTTPLKVSTARLTAATTD